jgi:hypothetical protein
VPVYMAPSPVTSTTAPIATCGGSLSVPVYMAPSPVTYTSTAMAPSTCMAGPTEIRGSSVSIAPAVYTAAPASPMVTYGAKTAMRMGGGSVSVQPHEATATMVAGSSVEIAPALRYMGSSVSFPAAPAPMVTSTVAGSSVSYPAAPAPMVTSTVAAPSVTNTQAVPTKVERLVSAPVVTAMRTVPVTHSAVAPPVTVATIPPVTTVTAPPVTTATVMEPLPTKVYKAPTARTYVSHQQPGLVPSISSAAFDAMDQNHDGVITRAEFNNAMAVSQPLF